MTACSDFLRKDLSSANPNTLHWLKCTGCNQIQTLAKALVHTSPWATFGDIPKTSISSMQKTGYLLQIELRGYPWKTSVKHECMAKCLIPFFYTNRQHECPIFWSTLTANLQCAVVKSATVWRKRYKVGNKKENHSTFSSLQTVHRHSWCWRSVTELLCAAAQLDWLWMRHGNLSYTDLNIKAALHWRCRENTVECRAEDLIGKQWKTTTALNRLLSVVTSRNTSAKPNVSGLLRQSFSTTARAEIKILEHRN